MDGGGPGRESDYGYPDWTRERTEAAIAHWHDECSLSPETCAVLALSAGSMNAPSARDKHGNVMFESTAIAEHLMLGGVPPQSIICDFLSWDTVANGWVSRMVVDALQAVSPPDQQLRVLVFISDFHSQRIKASMDWAFSLEPHSHDKKSNVEIVNVPSTSVHWVGGVASFTERITHEARGAEQLAQHMKDGTVRSLTEMQAFLFLGGHRGYFDFTHNQYEASAGAGWG